jgi:hypothetical protein
MPSLAWTVGVREQRHNASVTGSKSYEDDLPGSRQAPCLGCGGRVVTARDAHVEIGGKRDGSVLMVFEAQPLRAWATDPDRLFEPDLEHLGFAHRACVQLARQRLEAQQVELPDKLPRLIVDQEAGQLPALHLPRRQDAAPSAVRLRLPRSMPGLSGSRGNSATTVASRCHPHTGCAECARSTSRRLSA